MKKILLAAIAACSLAVFSYNASAQNAEYYFGTNSTVFKWSEDTPSGKEKADVVGVSFQAGAQINEYLATEFRFGLGLVDGQINNPANEPLGVDNFYGGYVRLGAKTSAIFYPYVITGYTRINGSNGSLSGASLGAGIDWELSDTSIGNFELISYAMEDDRQWLGFNVGFTQHF